MPGVAPRLFLLAVAAAALFIFRTSAVLPALVASHFDARGAPNGWMSRETYRGVALAAAVLLPLLVTFGTVLAVRTSPEALKLPQQAYWFAPERRAASQQYVAAMFFRIGTLVTMLVAALHYTVLRAHAVQPPHLPAVTFFTILGAFGALLVLVLVTMTMHFRKVPAARTVG